MVVASSYNCGVEQCAPLVIDPNQTNNPGVQTRLGDKLRSSCGGSHRHIGQIVVVLNSVSVSNTRNRSNFELRASDQNT